MQASQFQVSKLRWFGGYFGALQLPNPKVFNSEVKNCPNYEGRLIVAAQTCQRPQRKALLRCVSVGNKIYAQTVAHVEIFIFKYMQKISRTSYKYKILIRHILGTYSRSPPSLSFSRATVPLTSGLTHYHVIRTIAYFHPILLFKLLHDALMQILKIKNLKRQ